MAYIIMQIIVLPLDRNPHYRIFFNAIQKIYLIFRTIAALHILYRIWYNISMRKVIVKCKLKNRDEFERKLSDIDLDFSQVYWQHDRIYVPRNYKPPLINQLNIVLS